jgi:CheY-like chemotaxis protein
VNVPLGVTPPESRKSHKIRIDQDITDLSGLLVLLVENDQDFGLALTMAVQQMGAKVIHAENAQEALTILHEIQLVPDVFLFDYQLGDGMTGLELHEHVTRLYGPVTAAVISADRTRELRALCKSKGIPLMSKPLERGKLRSFLTACARTVYKSGSHTSPRLKR